MFLTSNFTCYHKTSTSWQEGSRPCGGPCCVWYCGFSCGARASERRTWAIQVQLERDDDSSEREARTVTSPRLVTAAAAPGHRGRPTSSGPRMPLHPLAGARRRNNTARLHPASGCITTQHSRGLIQFFVTTGCRIATLHSMDLLCLRLNVSYE